MRKLTLVSVATLAIGVAIVFGTESVSAHAVTSQSQQTLIQRIVQRFGLNQSEVEKVFDDHEADKKTHLDAKVEATLAQDVKDGKITESQKQIILAKYKELSKTNMTTEQLKAEKQELLDWAKENNLDVKYLLSRVMKLKLHHQKWK